MDLTYPLVPIVSLIAAFLIFLTFLTSVRQTWHAGIPMLCAWLFVYCLIQGFETIIWSDNAENKAPVWCDISSHLGIAVEIGVPACSLVITRHLCNITRLRTLDAPSKRQRRIEWSLDLFLGFGFPMLVMGPFYYVIQGQRFEVIEEVGCSSFEISSGLSTLLVDLWPVILPLISATFYCPRILWVFYQYRKELDAFLDTNGTIVRARYFRILAVGCLDILFTFPTGALFSLLEIAQSISTGNYPFYPGWYRTHHSWAPTSVSAVEWRSDFWDRFQITFEFWLYPTLSILIFAVYGLTREARSTYRRSFWTVAGHFGLKPIISEDMTDMTFGSFHQDPRTWDQGHSLSMPEYGMTGNATFTLSKSFVMQDERLGMEGGSSDKITEVSLAERDDEEKKRAGVDAQQSRREYEGERGGRGEDIV